MHKINFFLYIFIFLLLSSCFNYKAPLAKEGIINFSGYDFNQHDIISLDGDYEVYWQELIFPGDFEKDKNQRAEFSTFPTIWNNETYRGKKLNGQGFATYRLKIIVDKTDYNLSMYIKNFSTSYRLYFNKKLIATNGVVSSKEKECKPHYYPNIIPIEDLKMTNELVLHIANFSHFQGGPWNRIMIGNKDKISDFIIKKFIFATIVFTFLLITSLLHILIFFKTKEKLFLYFSIFCILALICFLFHGQSEFRKFIYNIDWNLREKIVYSCLYVPIFPFILREMFPKLVNKMLFQLYVVFQFLLICFILITPTIIFTNTLPIFHGSIVLLCIYSLFVVSKALKERYEDSIFLFLSLLILVTLILIDIILTNQFPHIYFSLSFIGVIVFTFSLHYIIITKFIYSFKTIEKISQEFNLEKPIIQLDQKTIFSNIERELKKIKQNEEQLSKVLQTTPMFIIEIDDNFNINFLNKIAIEFLKIKSYNNLKLQAFLSEKEIKKLTNLILTKDINSPIVLNIKNLQNEHIILLSKLSLSFKDGKISGVKITGMDIRNIINKSLHPEDVLLKEYKLSHRESEVLKLLLQGYRIKDIANKLFIAESTVKEHLSSIYAEMNVKNKYELFEKLKEYKHTELGYESFLSYIFNHLLNE
ncbi:MAG: LuxR C-terminal-related transcriptional regulator [Brevinematales bacterium]|nr:LuxR C-terminal-related transcriptional regulator [Brevinematales bacterium]